MFWGKDVDIAATLTSRLKNAPWNIAENMPVADVAVGSSTR